MEPVVVHLGPSVTLICGDCLEVLPALEEIDAVVTDPPYSSGGAFRGDGGCAYQRHDERGDAARILSAGRRFGGAAGAGHGAAVAFGAGLRPHSESGPHDRRSGGARNPSGGRCGRSDQLPLAGPGKLGAVKGGRKGGERKEFVILQAACLGMLSGAEVCTPVFRSPGLRTAGDGRRGRCRGRAFELSGSSGFRVDGPSDLRTVGGGLKDIDCK